EAALTAVTKVEALMAALIDAAERHADWPLPGYTHLQRAQPVYLAHHLLAYVWMLDRDRGRFRFAAAQTGQLPLGAGALAGVNFETDRAMVAEALGFAGVAPNSIDAVSNRDFVLDYLNAAAVCTMHLSRLGAELVLWSSPELGFVELPDASPHLDGDVRDVLAQRSWLESKVSQGGTSSARVAEQLAAAKELLA